MFFPFFFTNFFKYILEYISNILFLRLNVKFICSLFLSLSLISCLNLLYKVINYEQFYVINLGYLVDFDNLSINWFYSYSLNGIKNYKHFANIISYLFLFTSFMIILLLLNNIIVIFIGFLIRIIC